MKANIDAVIAQWRIDNPDLANDKQSEDIVEFFLMKRVMVDPKNKNKKLPELLDLATEMAREYFGTVKARGREEGRRENETVIPITARPTRGGGPNGAVRVPKEEVLLTPEEAAENFLKMRQKMASKTAWGGRPS